MTFRRKHSWSPRTTLEALVLVCGLCLALALPASAGDLPSPEELFAKHTAAIGGDAIDKVENMAVEFTFSMPAMGLETTGQSYMERPDKTYSMISLSAMGSPDFRSGTNNGIAWQDNPQMGLRVLEGNEKRMALRGASLDSFAGWSDLWDKAETVAEETVGEAACYKVVLTPADGEPLSVWFDKETGLRAQEELPIPEMGSSVVTSFSDYRDVAGTKVPHHIEQEGMMPFSIDYTSVRLNVDDIPEGTFEVPESLQETASE
jgi:hypothetical protein